jgi:hypothetical protein
MAFEIPPLLLERLRARRDEERHRRTLGTVSSVPVAAPSSFLDGVKRLFETGSSPDEAGRQYVAEMDSWQTDVEQAYDAFLLDPGMGPMSYLTSDGRILEDQRGWDGTDIVELTGWRAHAALVIGARKTGIVELADLIPAAPKGSSPCPKCGGARLAQASPAVGLEFPCLECDARGWIAVEDEPAGQ